MDREQNILQRMSTRTPPDNVQVPQTSARAMRQALTRAADASIGLPLTVEDVHEATDLLDVLLPDLQSDHLHVALMADGQTVGCLSLDQQFRSAIIEFQTTGSVQKTAPNSRPMTGADLFLVLPLLQAYLIEGCSAAAGSDLAGWFTPVNIGMRFDSARAVGLALVNGSYRSLRLTVGIGNESRHGEIAIVLPVLQAGASAPKPVNAKENWQEMLRNVVDDAPLAMEAVLARFPMSIGQVDALRPGQIVPLFGADLGSVKLYAPNHSFVKSAKLGQSAGMRAVRIGQLPTVAMTDIVSPPSIANEIA